MSPLLSLEDQRAVVAEASRAPNVHNTQPTRWRFAGDDGVVLFRALDRVLPVADPTGHDVQASLGAAFEGTVLALSARGFLLGAPTNETEATADGCAPVVRASIQRAAGAVPDPLAEWVPRRRCYRGKFLRPSVQDIEILAGLVGEDTRLLMGSDELADVATLHDVATWSFESQAAYHRELWSWLRLSPKDPRYRRDGLNADCLALSPAERWAAARLLVPSRFAFLAKIGVARHLVSEGAQVRSSAAALVICPRRDAPAFDVGRRMYRLWLEITAAGFFVCPMSASADDPQVRAAIEHRCGLPSDRRVANVFRVGRARHVAESPRLPVDELLV